MALKEQLVAWHEGVTAYEEGRYKDAVKKFEEIEDGSARIYFNTACAYLRLNKVESAFMSLNETVKKDPHLAIGHFYRGIQQVKLRRYEGAIGDFDNAIQKLRGNNFINYLQLGMNYKLHIEDISIAKAYALYSNGKGRETVEVLVDASQKVEDDAIKKRLVDALHRVQKQSNGHGRGRLKSLRDEDWYHGNLSRDEAENQLHYDGDFLVRQSKNKKSGAIQYVLSVYWQGFRHILCVQDDEDKWKFEGRGFPSISDLVEHQMSTKSIVTKRSRSKLLTPIGKKLDSDNPLDLFDLPETCIFYPPKELIANLEKRNYVAKAKVISSTNPENTETLEVPEIQTSRRTSSSSSDITSSGSGSDGYLAPKPKPKRAPPVLLPDASGRKSPSPDSRERLSPRPESGDRRSNSRDRRSPNPDSRERRSPNPDSRERRSPNPDSRDRRSPVPKVYVKSDDKNSSDSKTRSRSYDRSREQNRSSDDKYSRRAPPPLPQTADSGRNVSRSSDNLVSEIPPSRDRREWTSYDDSFVDYVNVPRIIAPPKGDRNSTGGQIVGNRTQKPSDAAQTFGKGVQNELANALNARLKKVGSDSASPRARNSSGEEAPRRPPPPRR